MQRFVLFLENIAKEKNLRLQKEYKFLKNRRFRFDFAFPEIKLAIEVEGGIYTLGRHTRGRGYTNDVIKYNYAVLEGWVLVRFTTEQIKRNKFDNMCLTDFLLNVVDKLLEQ